MTLYCRFLGQLSKYLKSSFGSIFIAFISVPALLPYSAWHGNNLLPTPEGNGVYLISRRWPPYNSTSSDKIHELVCDASSCSWNELSQGIYGKTGDDWCCYYPNAVYVNPEIANCN